MGKQERKRPHDLVADERVRSKLILKWTAGRGQDYSGLGYLRSCCEHGNEQRVLRIIHTVKHNYIYALVHKEIELYVSVLHVDHPQVELLT